MGFYKDRQIYIYINEIHIRGLKSGWSSNFNPSELWDDLRKIGTLVGLMRPAFLHHFDQFLRALQRNCINLWPFMIHRNIFNDCHKILQIRVRSFSGQNFPQQDSIRVNVNFERVLLSFQELRCHPMLNKAKNTIVPSWVVIISASGDRESPKSATFILKLSFSFVTKTFKDLRSLWMMTGFI